MSRSRKEVACGIWIACKSQEQGKRMSNRRFSRKERQCLDSTSFDKLPHSTKELTDEWNLGGDGKNTEFVLRINKTRVIYD